MSSTAVTRTRGLQTFAGQGRSGSSTSSFTPGHDSTRRPVRSARPYTLSSAGVAGGPSHLMDLSSEMDTSDEDQTHGTLGQSQEDEADDDEFGADVLADIEEDLKLKEAIRANGGKRPRKKKDAKEDQVKKQTLKTRKLVGRGQGRETKTAKWARRERRLNPLISLLDIELDIVASDTSSSEGSIDTDAAQELSDTSKAIFQRAARRRQANLALVKGRRRRNARKAPDSSDGEDTVHLRPIPRLEAKGLITARKPASDDLGANIAPDRLAKVNAASPAKVQQESSESDDFSDDVSPMDTIRYQEQLARRKTREERRLAKAEGRPMPPKYGSKTTAAATSSAVSSKVDADDTEATEDSDFDDSMPDLPMHHPDYIAWTRRQSQKSLSQDLNPVPASSGKARASSHKKRNPNAHESVSSQWTGVPVSATPFHPFLQKRSKPKFEVKSAEQAETGGHRLGSDDNGKDVQIPASINRFLRSYQREGVEFFWTHYRQKEGGLLGDDMGLGKTIQVISFLCAIMHHQCTPQERNRRLELEKDAITATTSGPTALVIAPASVVDNWARELRTWSYLSVAIYRPGVEKRDRILKDFKRGRLDVLICGLEAARTHIEELAYLDFSCIFVDEVHKVKNPLSETSRAFQKFQCKVRFGLTGTAMQNRYGELHTVLDWCFPGRVGDRSQWHDYVEVPLKEAQKKDATQKQLAIGRTRAIALAHYLLPHFFLRRTKELIADQLPKKVDQIVFCPLTAEQKQAYTRLLAHHEVQVILTHDEPCPCGRRDEQGLPYRRDKCCNQDWANLILKWITIFCKVANHAVLIYPNKIDRYQKPEKFAQDQELTRWAYPDSWKNHQSGELFASSKTDMDASLCGKWPVLKNLLKTWSDNGDKVLLFSRSTRLMDALQHWIEFVPYNMVRLDGSVPPEKRLDLCDQFNNPEGGIFIFLISTLAGGVGLNLTAANKVVIFDPNWNPVADLQAMDRSYRWGQTRDVYVYRLVGAGSLEELIYTRQIYKQHQAEIAYDAANPSRMFQGVQDDRDNQGELFGVKNLFRYNESTNRTKHSIEQAQISELAFALLNLSTRQKKKRRRGAEEGEDEESDTEQTEEGLNDNQAVLDALTGKSEMQRDEEDEISRILKSSGVQYTHNHSDVVKSSTMEAKISRAAMKDIKDASNRGKASNQAASKAIEEIRSAQASRWAPSKAKKTSAEKAASPVDANPFEILFESGNVKEDELADLADALEFSSAAAMARAFAQMTKAQQRDLLAKARDIVEAS